MNILQTYQPGIENFRHYLGQYIHFIFQYIRESQFFLPLEDSMYVNDSM
jgi:hypothetical protein